MDGPNRMQFPYRVRPWAGVLFILCFSLLVSACMAACWTVVLYVQGGSNLVMESWTAMNQTGTDMTKYATDAVGFLIGVPLSTHIWYRLCVRLGLDKDP